MNLLILSVNINYLFLQHLVFLLQFLYFLVNLFHRNIVLHFALNNLQLMHQVDLTILLQLQDQVDRVFLCFAILHEQKQHYFDHLTNILALHQLFPKRRLHLE